MSCTCFAPTNGSWLSKLATMVRGINPDLMLLNNGQTMEIPAFAPVESNLVVKERKEERVLIKGGFLYTADENNTVIKDSWILVEGNKIKQIGSSEEAIPVYDNLVDVKGKLVLPGLINPHWHESFVAPNFEEPNDTDLKPTAYSNGGDIEALGAMFGFISTVGAKLTEEEALAIARWSMWTQLRSGTTTLGDVGSANSADGMAQAAIDLGMRIRVSRWGSDIMIPRGASKFKYIADTQAQIDDWLALMEKWNNHKSGLVGGMPSVMGAFGSSDEQLIAMKEIADQFNAPYATHLGALKNEAAAVKGVFGKSSIGRFNSLGLLTDKLLAVHTAYATDAEYEKLLANKVNICHSPAHYGMLGEATVSETKQITRFLKDGAMVSTSTDGDITFIGGMCEAMRAAHLGHNEAQNCNTACPPTLALKTGSLFGAKALGWDKKIGSIEVGKQADIVMIDIDDYRYKIGNHPLRTFLVTGSSKDVDTVMVAGKIVVWNGQGLAFNEAELYSDYEKAVVSARKRIGKP